jgi:hypothetical protein
MRKMHLLDARAAPHLHGWLLTRKRYGEHERDSATRSMRRENAMQ